MKKFTITDIYNKIEENEKISFLTAYDYPTSHFAKQAGIEMILVGDSGGMCLLGKKTTIEVNMDEMLMMTEAVAKANDTSFIVADMPFMSYQTNNYDAISNAGKFMRYNVDAVKLEGGSRVSDKVKAIVDAGIPVMGHLGLTPQAISQLGGYKVQGKTISSVQKLIQDIDSLVSAGVFSILLEAIPNEIVQQIIATKIIGRPNLAIAWPLPPSILCTQCIAPEKTAINPKGINMLTIIAISLLATNAAA
mgnify:CR=1 FL=1